MHPPHARRITSIAIALALAIALTACTPNNNAVTSVTIDGGDRTIVLGDPLTLTATITTTGTADDAITWTSSNENVATIDATGTVTSTNDGTTDLTATSVFDPTRSDTITLTVDPLVALRWTRQFGTVGLDGARGVATDANGKIYVAGYTDGTLESPSAGGSDAFLRAYDPNGAPLWTQQFGASGSDVAIGVATDASGNVYVAGNEESDPEGPNAGSDDAFLRAYNPSGTELWTRPFGTSSNDGSSGVATDAAGNLYVSGSTSGDLAGPNAGAQDAFLRAYDGNGNLRWTRQFGTDGTDLTSGVATDAAGNVYVSGSTSGNLAGPNAGAQDAFLRAYDGNGNLRWTRQFGTTVVENATGVATDADGNVYLSGATSGDLEGTNAGFYDVFLRAYDATGEILWTHQFGTIAFDAAWGVATDANGNTYVAGYTDGDLEGTNIGGGDAFLRAFDRNGTLLWTDQFGTARDDAAQGVATDANGHVYATGHTFGALEGTNNGAGDAFLRAYGR